MRFYTCVEKKGNNIHHFGYENGKKFHQKRTFKPSIFYKVNSDSDAVSLFGDNLKERKFDSINEWSGFYYQNKDILDMYSDLDPKYQFIARNYKGEVEYDQNLLRIWFLDIEVKSEEGFPYPHESKWPVVSIAIYDTKRDEYLVISLKDYVYDETRLPLNTKKVKHKKVVDEADLFVKFFELIEALKPDIWVAHHGENFDYPYIINRGKNINADIKRLSPIGRVSSKYTPRDDKFMSGKSEYFNSISGISLLDNELLYKKYIATPRESWSLSNLAVEDLGMDKINYDEYDNLNGLYDQNYTKFIDYNITDVYLMFLLNKKNRYLDIHIRNMYVSKCANFEEPIAPTKLWDIYIYHDLQESSIQIPPSKKNIENITYPGAFVVEPLVGLHRHIVTFDLNSLYPSIKMQWNISPEKLVEDLTVEQWLQSLKNEEIDSFILNSKSEKQTKFLNDLKDMNTLGYAIEPIDRENVDQRMLDQVIPPHPDYVMTANGYYFKKDNLGCVPALLLKNYNERKLIKKAMVPLKKKLQEMGSNKEIEYKLSAMYVNEQAIKIMMNAEYGTTGEKHYRYSRYELCSSVTMTGQLVIKTLINEINKKFPNIKVIFGDTDSIGLGLEYIVNESCKNMNENEIIQWITDFCNNSIQPIINETYDRLSKYVNASQNYMKMSREKIISDGIWVAKKHYAYRMVVEDDLILSKPKFGYKGLSCVKSSVPRFIRVEQKKAIETILTNIKDISSVMNECKKTIMKLAPEDIGFPKTCNGLSKYSDENGNPIKGAGSHVKAALIYNKYIKENNLENQYPIIQNGEKIRFVQLKEPNKFDSETFGFISRLPKDPMILEFIDYEKMYQKGFEKPITDILEKIGMEKHNSKTVDLGDLF